MTRSGLNEVFGDLTWSNFRAYLPKEKNHVYGAWTERPNPGAMTAWYALLMDVVDSVTNPMKTSHPAKYYAVEGVIDEHAKWTDDFRTELVFELFEHLYKQAKDTDVPTGNQFAYIEGAARDINHIRNFLKMHLRDRVLHARFIKTVFGRASDQMFTALKHEPFIDTTPNTKQFRQKLIGVRGFESLREHDETKTLGLAIHQFTVMKRNRPTFGDTTKDEPQRAVNWFKTAEYVKAVTRIITGVVKGPVTPDFLNRALEHALRGLEEYRESREATDNRDDEFDETDVEHRQIGSNVRFEGRTGLCTYVPLEIEEEVGALLPIMYKELTKRHPTRDIDILFRLSTGEKIKEIAENLGVDVKTVSRRRNEIDQLQRLWVAEYDETVVGMCLRNIFGDRSELGVAQ